MQSISTVPRVNPAPLAEPVGQASGPGRILLGVFATLDSAGIPYCVLHGYENYPDRVMGDVDCLIARTVTPAQLAALLHRNKNRIGAEVVRSRGYYFTLAGKDADGSPCFLELDFCRDYELDNRLYFSGPEVLAGRRRHEPFWVPAAAVEFGCYLVRRIAKGSLSEEQGQRLRSLYQQDEAGCRQQVGRFWGASSAAPIVAAADSGDWDPVRHSLTKLRSELRRRATLRHPFRVMGNKFRRLASRLRRAIRPDNGLNVVFLGTDGAGKSSVLQAVRRSLTGAFPRTDSYGFPPALLRRFRRQPEGPFALPHALPPRSYLSSAARAVLYWFVYCTFGYYVTVRPKLARSALVLHDRHFVDALVDPRRYRYGGPSWLLRLIWRFVPKPDLVILLDAPPEVLQARKQELPFAETTRQTEAYRALVATMANGHVVRADRSLDEVVGDVNDLILRHLATRVTRRLGLEQNP